ncbi:MAG: PocR ligand-binding domain-containing protein [Clostridia bacterium]
MLQFDMKKLEEVLKAFHSTTGARVAIYDISQNEIISYPKSSCELCRQLRSNEKVNAMCKKSDKKAFEKCLEIQKSYTYECNMGLHEAIAPIKISGKIEGFIMMGQVITRSSKFEIKRKIDRLFSENQSVLDSLERAEGIELYKLTGISYLMNLCVEYLCSAHYIAPSQGTKAKKIDAFISENIDRHISVEEICEKFSISRSTVHNLVKETYKMSVVQRINFLKIEKAKKLLLNKHRLDFVCDKLGFSDKNYFYRTFKKQTGKSVKEFLFDGE